MQRAEYLDLLYDVLDEINCGQYAVARKKLDGLNTIYPKSLGKLLCDEVIKFRTSEKYYSPYEQFEQVFLFLDRYTFVRETIDFFIEASTDFIWENNYKILWKMLGDEFVHDVLYKLLVEQENDINCLRVCNELYGLSDSVSYVIHREMMERKYPHMKDTLKAYGMYERTNIPLMLDNIWDGMPIIIIESDGYGPLLKTLANDLKFLNVPVCFINLPDEISDSTPDLLWEKTLQSQNNKDGIVYFTPVSISFEDGYCANNIDDLLGYIKDSYFSTSMVGVIGEMKYMLELATSPSLQKSMFNVTTGIMSRAYECMNYFLYGNYFDYISKIYKEDVNDFFNCESKVKFSIIIPARNSVETLKYTVRTCLNQTYSEQYEILISDNSTEFNSSVCDYVKELDDCRVKYIKTPRNLHLPKSFEYAFLHARGEYVLSVGSDDGLLSWALEVLDTVTKANPMEEVIKWDRGFYAWPGFNKGQQNQFVIPRNYAYDDYCVSIVSGLDYLAMAFNNPRNMYNMPMFYINSCFKRSYLKTLLEKTGRLWDGTCQDIYMGVVNSAINTNILEIKYPIAIAGMSPSSIGYASSVGVHTEEELCKVIEQERNDAAYGGYCRSYYENLLPVTGTDTWSLYTSILRCISIGIIPKEYLNNVIDWKKWYTTLADELDITDITFDGKINDMRYHAQLLGMEFAQWFEKEIFIPKTQPVYIDTDRANDTNNFRKRYTVGRADNGSITLDASEYGVSNIAEAVGLFESIIQSGIQV